MTENNEWATGKEAQPRDPGCFEEWLFERRNSEDEVGRVARWVVDRMKPDHPARWTPEPVLLARHGHAYDVPARYEDYLRHVANEPDESIETFFRVYDLYLKDARADYDQMVEERSRKLGEELGGEGDDNGGKGTAAPSGDDPRESFSWESWARFFYELHGPEQVGYELDEDGWPVGDPNSDVEGR
jgi:hypothetical protein